MPTRRSVLNVVFLVLLGVFLATLPRTWAQLSGSYSWYDPIIDIHETLRRNYVDPINDAEDLALQEGAIRGMLDSLNDPYAEYVAPRDQYDFHKALTGEFVGIGAEVTIEGGWMTIVTPLEDSPAFRAGILAGDRVVEIEGKTTRGEPIEESIARLAGKPGTRVSFLIEREDNGQPRQESFTLTRERIVARAVRGFRRAGDGHWDFMIDPAQRIAYIRLSQFTPAAADEVGATLASLGVSAGAEPGINALILDLRGNPGGDLVPTLELADMFLGEGGILTVRGREGATEEYAASRRGTLPDFPLMVLVNGGSASASEILSGALQDHGRAIVLGERTFGKGLVQVVESLPSGGGALVKYTRQRYELPSGRAIHRADDSITWGVDPDPGFYVPESAEQFRRRVLSRRRFEVIPPSGIVPEGDFADPDWVEETLGDVQLAAAVRAANDRLGAGVWREVSDAAAQPGEILKRELAELLDGRRRLVREVMRTDSAFDTRPILDEVARLDKRIDALRSATGEDELAAERDLWDDQLDVTGGTVEVRDKEGNLIRRLGVTGPSLEEWLIDADVEPEPVPAGAADEPEDGAGGGG